MADTFPKEFYCLRRMKMPCPKHTWPQCTLGSIQYYHHPSNPNSCYMQYLPPHASLRFVSLAIFLIRELIHGIIMNNAIIDSIITTAKQPQYVLAE